MIFVGLILFVCNAALAQQPATDYAALTQPDQPGDSRLRCAQISIMVGQMNGLVANGTGSAHSSTSGLGSAAGTAVKSTMASKARGFLSSLGGGILGDLASGAVENGIGRRDARSDPNANIRLAAATRRDRLLALASAKNCAGDPAIAQARAAQAQSSQNPNDRPMHFIQRNTYRGGIQDCTQPGSCTSSDNVTDQSVQPPCRTGNLPGQFCSDGQMSARARNLVTRGVTLRDAVKCNSVFTVMEVLGSPSSIGNETVPYTAVSQNSLLWDIIWHLSPSVQNASSAETKQGYFIRARDTPIQDDIPKYRSNEKLMLTDYKYCISKGIIPGEQRD